MGNNDFLWLLLFVGILAVVAWGLHTNDETLREEAEGQAEKEKQLNATIERFIVEFRISDSVRGLHYVGGHPELDLSTQVILWATPEALHIGEVNLWKAISIPVQNVVRITMTEDVQVVNVGGGRSITGALIGGAVAGAVGAIVGGRAKTEVKEFDKSKTFMDIRYNGTEFRLVFEGGASTYNTLAAAYSRATAPSEGTLV